LKKDVKSPAHEFHSPGKDLAITFTLQLAALFTFNIQIFFAILPKYKTGYLS